MKAVLRYAAALAVGGMLLGGVAASAEEFGDGVLRIDQPWIKGAQHPGANVPVSMAILNIGPGADQLTGASAEVSRTVTLKDCSAKPPKKLSSLSLQPEGLVELSTGGPCIMLEDLTRSLQEGDVFPLVLHFQAAGKIHVQVEVKAAKSMADDINLKEDEAALGGPASTPSPEEAARMNLPVKP